MKEEYTLIDKCVEVFADGGWSFYGVIEYEDESRIIIMDEDPIVVYKNKICGIRIVEEEEGEEDFPREQARVNHQYAEHTDFKEKETIANYQSEQQNHYGSIIPSDMLIGEADKPDDLFINFSTLKNPPAKVEKSEKNDTSK